MRLIRKIASGFMAVTVALAFFSCYRAQNCAPQTWNYVIVEFLDSLGVPKPKMLTITSLTSDSILSNIAIPSTKFQLPLDPFQNNVTFVFTSSSDENWLSLGYRNAAFVNSEDCGPEFIFSELTVWGTSFDSVRVVNDRFFESVERNILIYEK